MTYIMVAVYAVQQAIWSALGDPWHALFFLQVPGAWGWPIFWSPFTNLISHNVQDPRHLINLLLFLPLGSWFERRYGGRLLVMCFFLLGAFASSVQVELAQRPALGSSAALAVLAGAWFAHAQTTKAYGPWTPVIWILPVSLFLPIALMFWSPLANLAASDVGHWSHAAGFLIGTTCWPWLAPFAIRSWGARGLQQ